MCDCHVCADTHRVRWIWEPSRTQRATQSRRSVTQSWRFFWQWSGKRFVLQFSFSDFCECECVCLLSAQWHPVRGCFLGEWLVCWRDGLSVQVGELPVSVCFHYHPNPAIHYFPSKLIELCSLKYSIFHIPYFNFNFHWSPRLLFLKAVFLFCFRF